VVRAWIVAGKPSSSCKSLASYGQWSDRVRQPLLWLGVVDPAQSVFDGMENDPDRETLGRFLHAWTPIFGKRPTMVREVVANADRSSYDPRLVELHEVIADIADERGQINRKRLGWWISKHAGRLVDGLKFEKAPGKRNADQWQVVSVIPALPVPSATTILSVSSVSSVASGPTEESVSDDDELDSIDDMVASMLIE